MYWYESEPRGNGCVLSTRVRFARNLEGVPFPARLPEPDAVALFERVREAFGEYRPMAIPFGEAEDVVKNTYVQTHLASRELAAKGAGSGLLLSREGDVAVMVNEEDHIRLQVIRAGRDVEGAMAKAKEWMKKGEEMLPIAYRDGLGYLTACPTNLGSGMRLSVMIHLPALTASGAISSLVRRLGDLGFVVRGLYGEGTGSGGDVYQISNQGGREKSPDEIASVFSSVLDRVEEWERSAAERLLKEDRLGWEDRILRALGTLKYARKMSYSEFMKLYSLVRFGREQGIVGTEHVGVLDRVMVEVLPAPMILRDRTLTDPADRDAKRSERIREALCRKE